MKEFRWESKKRPQRPPTPSEEEVVDAYIQEIANTMEAASEGQGFIAIVAKQVNLDGRTVLIPELYGFATTPGASRLLDAQVLQVAANAFTHLSTRIVRGSNG